jgi:hypothetical protein
MEVLEDRMVPSTLTVNGPADGLSPQVFYSGNSVNDTLTIKMVGGQISFTDSDDTITVLDPSGQFKGTGTDIVTGPVSATADGIFVSNPLKTDLVIDDSEDSLVRATTLKTSDSTTGVISGLPSGPLTFPYNDVPNLQIFTGYAAGNVVNVMGTGSSGGTFIYGTGAETVNVVGSSVGLAAISAPLFIDNTVPAQGTSLTVDDSADTNAHTAVLSTSLDALSGFIDGLGGAKISYKCKDTNGVTIKTGTNALDVVNVQDTGGLGTTSVVGSASVTVKVGNGGSLAGIQAPLGISNSNLKAGTTLVVDDSADLNVHKGNTAVNLSEIVNSHLIPFGSISGLAPASIDYLYYSTSNVQITTGPVAGNVVNVHATTGGHGATTIIGTAAETVNVVGSSGGLAGISNPLTIENTAHSTALTVDDSADTTARTAVLSTSVFTLFGSISGLGGAAISYKYKDTTGVTINTGTNAKDVVNVQSTGPVPVTLVGHAALAVNVGSAGMALGVEGLTVENVGGISTLQVDDSADLSMVNLTFSTVLRRPGYLFDLLSSPTSTIVAYKDASTQSVTLKTGTGNDQVNVVNTGVQANLVNGGGHDTVVFSDGASLSGGTITGGLGNTLDYHLYSTAIAVHLAVNPATGAATGTGGASNVKGVIAGKAGGNLYGANMTNLWQIKGTNSGNVNGVVYAGIQNLIGGMGVDTFQFMSTAGTEQSIGGGGLFGQGDWLDYSLFTTPVTVNLANGSATEVNFGFPGAVTNIQNVISGSGKDTLTGNSQGNILIGHGSDDTIKGGSGRSLLIGGAGASTVYGGSGGDILIGGTTTYDTTNHAALMTILAAWQAAGSYTSRTAAISSGTILGHLGIELTVGQTVTKNSVFSAQQLIALASTTDLDWFFASAGRQHSHLETIELVS